MMNHRIILNYEAEADNVKPRTSLKHFGESSDQQQNLLSLQAICFAVHVTIDKRIKARNNFVTKFCSEIVGESNPNQR